MPDPSTKEIVKITLEALSEKNDDSKISELVISAGIEPKKASNVVSSIRDGFKAGTASIVIGSGMPDNQDPYFQHAFRRGRAAMRFTSPFWVLMRYVIPIAIALALIIFLLSRFVF